jgi:hypothetical protein
MLRTRSNKAMATINEEAGIRAGVMTPSIYMSSPVRHCKIGTKARVIARVISCDGSADTGKDGEDIPFTGTGLPDALPDTETRPFPPHL